MQVNKFGIANGVTGMHIKKDNFNTTRISYNFYLPLKGEDMAGDALVPYILSTCSEKYKNYIDLNIRLLELYGADLSCSVSKYGDYMHIKMGISVINDEFSYDSEKPVSLAYELLNELVFNPSLSGEAFRQSDAEREKRKTLNRIKGEINDKRSFARTRLFAEMFENDPYGKFIYGTEEELGSITEKELYAFYKKLIETSIIKVTVIGKELPQNFLENLRERFSLFNRENIADSDIQIPLKERSTVKDITERYDVTQGKLVMGFSSQMRGSLEETAPAIVCADIFGGGPYSKLFNNVREKQSLCYYCSASFKRNKGFLLVDSGVEEANAEKLYNAVLKEFEDLKAGNFDDSLIESSKKALTDAFMGSYDSASSLENWYGTGFEEKCSPKEAAEIINNVTREEIVAAAKGFKPHTVFRLLTKGGDKQ